MVVFCIGALVTFAILEPVFYGSDKPEPEAEYCAEELTQRVLTPSGQFEVSTHCVRKEAYVLPGDL